MHTAITAPTFVQSGQRTLIQSPGFVQSGILASHEYRCGCNCGSDNGGQCDQANNNSCEPLGSSCSSSHAYFATMCASIPDPRALATYCMAESTSVMMSSRILGYWLLAAIARILHAIGDQLLRRKRAHGVRDYVNISYSWGGYHGDGLRRRRHISIRSHIRRAIAGGAVFSSSS
jgi:hypothetical protein